MRWSASESGRVPTGGASSESMTRTRELGVERHPEQAHQAGVRRDLGPRQNLRREGLEAGFFKDRNDSDMMPFQECAVLVRCFGPAPTDQVRL
jgi:hypothetical protein